MQHKIKLGGHLYASEGYRFVVVNARAMGYNCVQIMLAGQDEYHPMDMKAEDVQEFKKMLYGIDLYVHLPYVINPCESFPSRRGFYARTYKAFCNQAVELGAKGVVIHPGFKKDLPEQKALKNAVEFFRKYSQDDWPLEILVETDSGSKNGSAIGSISFINELLEKLDHPKHKMCLDTEHLYARGVNLWDPKVLKDTLDEAGKNIRLVHLNCPDLEVELGSHRDRHNIPFEDRPWDHANLIRTLTDSYPCILERRSLAVQEKDMNLIRSLIGDQRQLTLQEGSGIA